ncbi:MAG: SpoIIE family protein phosphatase [Chitinivibrionales bacterium]|nr:SpoIIE family protein phosphatase [Chitinivibrionales bacterium]
MNTLDQVRQLTEHNEMLKAQLMNTSMITELTKVMHSNTDLDGILKTLLLGMQDILGFDRAILFSIDAEHFCLRPQAWVGCDDGLVETITIPLGFEGGEITDSIFLNKHLIIDQPDTQCDIFSRKMDSQSYLVIPLLSKATKKCWEFKVCNKTSCPAYGGYNPYCWSIPGAGEAMPAISEDERRRRCVSCSCFKCTGVFWLDRNASGRMITSDDVTNLTSIINQAGLIIENFRILEELEVTNNDLSKANNQLKIVNNDLQVANTKINNDLDHARTIQQGLLPQDINVSEDVAISAKYIPASAVGGDYYDVFKLQDDKYGIIVADVSGHGVASALIMSMAKVLLKIFAKNEFSPQKTLENINETFLKEIKTDNFVTIFYAVLDTSEHILHYTSAGHCPVLFIKKQQQNCERINADGLFLGIFPDMMLKETHYAYEPGKERIILYTDGLTEAQNNEEVMYDLQRLEEIALQTAHEPADKTVVDILNHQRTFCGPDRPPEDDITLLVIDL